MTDSKDLALETLLQVRREVASDLDETILRRCYEIEKRYQFERERSVPYKALEALVEDHIDSLLTNDQ